MTHTTRFRLPIALALAAALLTAAARPGPPTAMNPPTATSPPTSTTKDGVMVLGSPRAKVVVAEYASVGCPHCAHWARTVYPVFKVKYIDSGRVRFAFHEMLTGDGALAAAGFLLARCAGPARYFRVVDQIFARQGEIAVKGASILLDIGKSAGVTEDRFKACLSDDAALKALNERTEADAKAHGVQGTPTFFVNGVRMKGDAVLADFDTAIVHARRP